MSTSITYRTKIRVNGREYSNIDNMPADVRDAYERALATMQGAEPADLPSSKVVMSSTKLIFQGKEYGSVEDMPLEVRRRYKDVVAAALESAARGTRNAATAPGHQQPGDGDAFAKPLLAASALRPESTPSWVPIAAVVIGALVLASFVFGR